MLFRSKPLYAWTLALAGGAGFSAGWSARPPEVRLVTTWQEQEMMMYEAGYRMSPSDREAVRACIAECAKEIDSLSREFDARFQPQVDAVKDRYSARIGSILTGDKRR